MSARSKKKSLSSLSKLYGALAKKLINESVHLKPGESVTIETWNTGLDFARELVKEARRSGAIPITLYEDEEAYLDGLQNAPKESLGKMGKHEYNIVSSSDAYIFVPGPAIAGYSPNVPRELASQSTSYNSSWYQTAEKAKLRGVRLSFGYVGKEISKLLGKSQEEIIRHQIKASLIDSQKLREIGRPIMESLTDGAESTLDTAGERLSFRLKGDLGIEDGLADDADVASGNNISYLPPGFVWKEVDESSVSGRVRAGPSVSRLGIVEDATLEFNSGRLVGWNSRSKQSKQKLDSLVSVLPEDKRILSTITIGINPAVKFGYYIDRFVSGSLGLAGFGYNAIVRGSTLRVGEKTLIEKGKIVSS